MTARKCSLSQIFLSAGTGSAGESMDNASKDEEKSFSGIGVKESYSVHGSSTYFIKPWLKGCVIFICQKKTDLLQHRSVGSPFVNIIGLRVYILCLLFSIMQQVQKMQQSSHAHS